MAVLASTVTAEANPPLLHFLLLCWQLNFRHCAESKSCAAAGCTGDGTKIPNAQKTPIRDIVRKSIM